MTVIGTIKRIEDTQEISDSFQKREFVVTTKEDYPQDIGMEFIKDKCSILDKYKPGEEVTVEVNLKGRDWESPKDGTIRNFITLQAWKIDYSGEHADALEGKTYEEQVHAAADKDDDLPF